MKSDKNLSEKHLDSYLVDEFMLAAYPNKLVFGKALIKKRNLYFSKWTYLEIVPNFYSEWIKALREMAPYLTESKLKEKTVIAFKDDYIIYWSSENEIVTFHLEQNNSTKLKLEFNILIYNEFLNAFKQLFFKPFVLQPWVYIPFSSLIEKMSEEEISTINDQSVFKIAQKFSSSKNSDIIYNISEMILRYKNILKQSKLLSHLVPELPNLSQLS